MKKILNCLLAVMLSAAALTACGTDTGTAGNNGQAGTGSVAGGSVVTGDEDGVNGSIPDNGTAENGPTDGMEPDGTLPGETASRGASDGRTIRSSTGTRTQSGSLVRSATYEQMLRNGAVHDRDGLLTDGENAVTPGTVS